MFNRFLCRIERVLSAPQGTQKYRQIASIARYLGYYSAFPVGEGNELIKDSFSHPLGVVGQSE